MIPIDVCKVLIQQLHSVFTNSTSGFGKSRCRSITHDTKKALLQTLEGLSDLCNFLFSVGFTYVLIGEIQSDCLEGEFGVYLQSTGANPFMMVNDVSSTFNKRLVKFTSLFLEKSTVHHLHLQHILVKKHLTMKHITLKIFIQKF